MSEKISFLLPEDMTPRYAISALSEIQDWGLLLAGVPEAHKKTRGAGVTVAVLDTGSPTHHDLSSNLLPPIDCTSSGSVQDVQGHATHVCGTVAALSNGIGVVGVAPEAKILPIKVLYDNGTSGFQEIEKGIESAINSNVDIINLSLGTPITPPESLHAMIKKAADKGIIMVAAAGNDYGSVSWPARYPEVIAVGAMDKQGQLAPFSNRGSEISIIAPGVDIYSTYLQEQYACLSGTSQAAPFVSGVLALLISWQRMNAQYVQPITSIIDALQRLDDMCDPVGRIGVAGKTNDVGFGIPTFANVRWE